MNQVEVVVYLVVWFSKSDQEKLLIQGVPFLLICWPISVPNRNSGVKFSFGQQGHPEREVTIRDRVSCL